VSALMRFLRHYLVTEVKRMMKNGIRLLTIGLVAFDRSPAVAQSYPSKPIRIIVPFAAGGSVDALARVVGPVLDSHRGSIRNGWSHYAELAAVYLKSGCGRHLDRSGAILHRSIGAMTRAAA
jgi:hypothetical protein